MLLQQFVRERYYQFFIFLVVQACRLVYLLDVSLGMIWKIWLPTSNLVWSWCTCYLSKLYHQMCKPCAWHVYYNLVFKVFRHSRYFSAKQLLAHIAWQITCQLFSIRSKNQYLFSMRYKDGSYNSAQKVYGHYHILGIIISKLCYW